jgi:hypothetical protein
MSTHYRAAWRSVAEAAVLALPRYTDTLAVRPWGRNIEAEQLPVLSVTTEQERAEWLDKGTVRRTVTIIVRLWRADTGCLHDDLDDDSAAIEAAVLPALKDVAWDAAFTGAAIRLDGQTQVGLLEVTFTAIRDTPEGAPLTEAP